MDFNNLSPLMKIVYTVWHPICTNLRMNSTHSGRVKSSSSIRRILYQNYIYMHYEFI